MNDQISIYSNSVAYEGYKASGTSLRQLIFDFALITVLITDILSNSSLGISRTLLEHIKIYTALFSLLINFVSIKTLSYKQLFVIAALGILIFICYLKSGITTALILYLFIVSSKNIDFRRAVKIIRNVLLIAIVLLVLLALSGTIENVILYKNGNPRYALGFNHSNIMGYMYLQLCMTDGYLRYKKLKVRNYFSLLLIAFIVIYFTYSYSSGLSITLFYLLMILSKLFRNSKFKTFVRRIASFSFLFCGAISIWAGVTFNAGNSVMFTLNKLVTGRIELANIFFKLYGFTLFGSRMDTASEFISKSQLMLDNSYMSILLENGIIVIIILLILYYVTINKTKVKDDIPLLICIIISALIGITERTVLDITTNFTLFIFSYILYQSGTNKKKGKIKVN